MHLSVIFKVVTLALIIFGITPLSEAATLTVVADNGVGRHFADTNRGSDQNLWGGSGFMSGTGDVDGRSYLKFTLPSYVPGTVITSATLSGFYLFSDSPRIDDTFSFYLAASDAWTESTQTWNNQPGMTGAPLATFSSVGLVNSTRYSWDITSVVNSQYQGDGVLSIVLRADNESLGSGSSYKYFASKENSLNQPFRIDYTVAPEPSTAILFSLGAVLFLAYRRRMLSVASKA